MPASAREWRFHDVSCRYAQDTGTSTSLSRAATGPVCAESGAVRSGWKDRVPPLPTVFRAPGLLWMFRSKVVAWVRALLKDALTRVAAAADEIGARAVLVHAKDDGARNFYQRYDFEPSPTDPLHLFLLMKDLRAAIKMR